MVLGHNIFRFHIGFMRGVGARCLGWLHVTVYGGGDVVFSARDPTKTRISSLRSEISICVVPPSTDSDLDIFLRS